MAVPSKKIATILIVDDEPDLATSMRDTLVNENFSTAIAPTGEDAIRLAQELLPDAILLDLRLPDIDGYEVCRRLKQNEKTARIPIMMVSTRSKDTEKVVGLELGADDYLTKPYSEIELLARIRVMLRSRVSQPEAAPTPIAKILEEGPLWLDPESRRVKVEGNIVDLTRKEFDLLALFMTQPGKVLSRRYLLEAVWGYEVDSLQGTVDSHIKTLRKKLGSAAVTLQTVTGVGYRFEGPD